jgi:hypothetical protein
MNTLSTDQILDLHHMREAELIAAADAHRAVQPGPKRPRVARWRLRLPRLLTVDVRITLAR